MILNLCNVIKRTAVSIIKQAGIEFLKNFLMPQHYGGGTYEINMRLSPSKFRNFIARWLAYTNLRKLEKILFCENYILNIPLFNKLIIEKIFRKISFDLFCENFLKLSFS